MTVTQVNNVRLIYGRYGSPNSFYGNVRLFYEHFLIPEYDNYFYLEIPSSITISGDTYSGFYNFRRKYSPQSDGYNEYSSLYSLYASPNTLADLLWDNDPKFDIIESATYNMNGTNVKCLKIKVRFPNSRAVACLQSGVTYGNVVVLEFGNFFANASDDTTFGFRWEVGNVNDTTSPPRCQIPFCTFAYSGLKPTVSLVASDPTGYASSYGKYIVGSSQVNISTTVSLKYGATITGATGTGNNKSLVIPTTPSSVTVAQFGTLAGISYTTYSVTVTDSRGNTGTASVTIQTMVYTPPAVVTFTAIRCDSNGDPNPIGAYGLITYSVTFGSGTPDNVTNIRLEWDGDTTGYYNVGQASSHAKSGTYVFAATTASSYEVTIKLSDDVRTSSNPVTLSVSMSTAAVLMDWRKNGKGIAFGKICEHDGRIEFPDPAGTGAMVIYIGNQTLAQYIHSVMGS